jgi:alkaline phosphatase D
VAEEIDRREFLKGATALTLGASAIANLPASQLATAAGKTALRPIQGGEFRQGVASGQPTHRGITLWTKLSDVERQGSVVLEVAKDRGFSQVVERRRIQAREQVDHAAKTRVGGLDPRERYYYRFEANGESSSIGQFRTLPPPGSRAPIKIGIFSCQDYVAGFYTGHRGLAREKDLDLVVCLGDYIYERQFYDPQRPDTTGANGDGEVQKLSEYRDKYELYHSDRNLRRLRSRVPLAAIWDDHEVEDNYADEHPGAATIDPRVDFLRRRKNAYRAYFEHMPFAPAGARIPQNRFRIYRSIKFGETAELLLLDQRQYRDEQPCGDTIPPTPPCTDAERNDPSRTFLGAQQKAWLKRRLQASKATWKLIGNQAMIMAFDVPATQPINVDQWDGYGADRAEVLGHIADNEIQNVSFLTGDIHTFFAGDVSETGRQSAAGTPASVATEFVAGSMTSLGIPETINGTTGVPLPPEIQAQIADRGFLEGNNPHFTYSNTERRGYGVVTASADKLEVEYRSPQTTTERRSPIETLQTFEVSAGVPEVQLT